jgi:hypothetical protein
VPHPHDRNLACRDRVPASGELRPSAPEKARKAGPRAQLQPGARAALCALFSAAALALWLASAVAPAIVATAAVAQEGAPPIRSKNVDVPRTAAAESPRSEGDQALVDDWPLYRTDRGQEAFNAAMATLKATDGPAPQSAAFHGCADLQCNLSLPRVSADGWIPPGRLWISPTQYLLIAHSPRLAPGQAYRRRMFREMRYFVLHEFQNSSHNTDLYDTISAHSGSVFVPLYMSKQSIDAKGRHFVVVVQVAPYDVVSIHASNHGSAGPGMEVAKNPAEALEPLQGLAGILIATMIKAAAPQLQVVNHQNVEGLPMLSAYEGRLAMLRAHPESPLVALPFVPAAAERVATATGRLELLIARRGAATRAATAEPGTAPTNAGHPPAREADQGMSPLAAYLHENFATMKRAAEFAAILPEDAADVMERLPGEGIVYVLDAGGRTLGRIEAHRQRGVTVAGTYVYVPFDRASAPQRPFELDLSKPFPVRSAWLTPTATESPVPRLVEPIRPATRRAPASEPTLVEPIRPAVRPVALPGAGADR